MWNSSAFNPVAPPSECHFDFQTAIDCSYDVVKSLTQATPERVEDIFVSMRSHLLRIITRWEQSGQGEGGQDNAIDDAEDDDNDEASPLAAATSTLSDSADFHDRMIGSLSGRPARALQSRAAFLNGRPSYLLYFWEIADSHQILQSSLQRLSNTTGASDASLAPSTSASSNGARDRRRRSRQDDSDEDEALASSLAPLVQSIKEMVDFQRQHQERQFDNTNEHQLRSSEIEDRRRVSERRAQSSDRRFQRRSELLDLARKYRRLNAELDPNADQKSKRLSDFYVSEGNEIDKEIRLLDGSNEDVDGSP